MDIHNAAAEHAAAPTGGHADARYWLERVLDVLPRFPANARPDAVTAQVCELAAKTFEVDAARVWQLRDGSMHNVASFPQGAPNPHPGTTVPVDDVPAVARALAEGHVVSYILDTVSPSHARWMRHFGLEAIVQVPVSVDGFGDHFLSLCWARVPDEPPSDGFLAAAARFADHAALALLRARTRERQRREALEIQDDVVQNLAVAKWRIEGGDVEDGLRGVELALEAARGIVSDLAEGATDFRRSRASNVRPCAHDSDG